MEHEDEDSLEIKKNMHKYFMTYGSHKHINFIN